MSNAFEKVKKLSVAWKVFIIAGVFALVFLGLSIGSAFASPARAANAIEAIGSIEDIKYTEEYKEKIDLAIEYYEAIGKNGLGESNNFSAAYEKAAKEAQAEKLTAAKGEYARLAIKAADNDDRNQIRKDIPQEDIVALIQKARAVVEEYFKDNYDAVENYDVLVNLEKKYAEQLEAAAPVETPQTQAPTGGEAEEIELC
ncbi:MAG: hypothetical protein J6Z36_04060 [Clostridia bacterium]|nr:hypothetical protein [Clostridia bacterium]